MVSSPSQRLKGPSRLSSATEAKANACLVYESIGANSVSDWHVCEGTITTEAYNGLYRDIYCHQDDVFHGKAMVVINTMPGLILHVLQQCGFVDKVNVQDWPADQSPNENVWLIMKRRIRQLQITDCWASEVLHQARLDKKFACNTLTISILNP